MKNTPIQAINLVVTALLLCCGALTASATPVSSFTTTVQVNNRTFAVKGVRVDLNDPRVRVKVGLAWDHIGRTESLGSMVKRAGAVAAINGSFFAAYTKEALKNPDMSVITGGQLAFKSNIGTVLGFHKDNTPKIGCVRYRLVGTLRHSNGRSESWHAYWMNRKPSATPCVTIFNRLWGDRVEPAGGSLVTVRNDVVTAITREVAIMPADGYIVQIIGDDQLLARFQEGDKISLAPEVSVEGEERGGTEWAQVAEAVGAGPRVLAGGVPVFDPKSEQFSDPKILQLTCSRSAVGFTADRVLFLITTPSARVSDLGHILKALGCTEGMNLDGGASSALWYRGSYLTKPGRDISNALLVMEE